MSNSTVIPGVDKQEWSQAASKAKDAAASVGEMASHAVSAVGAMATRAACDVGKEADILTADAGACIQGMGERLGNNTPHSGVVGNATQAVAGAVKESGQYLQTAKMGGLFDDFAHLIKKNPLPAVLIAIGLGWYVGSKMRS